MTFKEWYNEENIEKVRQWAEKGLTREDIAKNIGITASGLWKWCNKCVDLVNALKSGQKIADEIIENALYKRAMGYDVEETQTEYAYDEAGKEIKIKTKKFKKHIPPDTTAQIFWLKNRNPSAWREKVQVGIDESITKGDNTIKVEFVNNADTSE